MTDPLATFDPAAILAELRLMRMRLDALWGMLDMLRKQTDARMDYVYIEFDLLQATVDRRLAPVAPPTSASVRLSAHAEVSAEPLAERAVGDTQTEG